MGLVVRVSCGCFVEGKTKPPFSGPIKVGEDGAVYLDLPLEGNEEKHSLFNRWRESGCEHQWMSYASEVITWGLYSSFQQALQAAGWEHFPTLRAEMPINDQRVTSANAALEMLEELLFFSTKADLGQTTVLLDTDTGEELQEYIAAYGGQFHVGQSGENFGVDQEGFFIRTDPCEGAKEVFRAMRIEQKIPVSSFEGVGNQSAVEFINLDSGFQYACGETMVKLSRGPDGRFRLEYPARMHVIKRKRQALEFEAVVNSLRTIFEAAVKIGNPIYW
ncbi:MAG: hypothetical protein J2P21_15750 [Chloracidobacterium sp.]|nr:hypothetical protein [Chloracidobacterium sp.]